MTWVLFVSHVIRALWLVSSAGFELRVEPFYYNFITTIFSVIRDWEFVSEVFFSKIFQTVIRKCINHEALFLMFWTIRFPGTLCEITASGTISCLEKFRWEFLLKFSFFQITICLTARLHEKNKLIIKKTLANQNLFCSFDWQTICTYLSFYSVASCFFFSFFRVLWFALCIFVLFSCSLICFRVSSCCFRAL